MLVMGPPPSCYTGIRELVQPGTESLLCATNHADFLAAIRDRATVHAMLEDYRAGLVIDRAHEAIDRDGGHQLTCPVLTLWSAHDDLEYLYGNPLDIWRTWAPNLRGHSLDCGHHMAEEAPVGLARALEAFFGIDTRSTRLSW